MIVCSYDCRIFNLSGDKCSIERDIERIEAFEVDACSHELPRGYQQGLN